MSSPIEHNTRGAARGGAQRPCGRGGKSRGEAKQGGAERDRTRRRQGAAERGGAVRGGAGQGTRRNKASGAGRGAGRGEAGLGEAERGGRGEEERNSIPSVFSRDKPSAFHRCNVNNPPECLLEGIRYKIRCTYRVQNPKISRANRVGTTHGRAAGRDEARKHGTPTNLFAMSLPGYRA